MCSPNDWQAVYSVLSEVGVEEAFAVLRGWEFSEKCELLASVAESVLPIWEAVYPDDRRPRQAIDATFAYAKGTISKDILASASKSALEACAECSRVFNEGGDFDTYVPAAYAADTAAAAADLYTDDWPDRVPRIAADALFWRDGSLGGDFRWEMSEQLLREFLDEKIKRTQVRFGD